MASSTILDDHRWDVMSDNPDLFSDVLNNLIGDRSPRTAAEIASSMEEYPEPPLICDLLDWLSENGTVRRVSSEGEPRYMVDPGQSEAELDLTVLVTSVNDLAECYRKLEKELQRLSRRPEGYTAL